MFTNCLLIKKKKIKKWVTFCCSFFIRKGHLHESENVGTSFIINWKLTCEHVCSGCLYQLDIIQCTEFHTSS